MVRKLLKLILVIQVFVLLCPSCDQSRNIEQSNDQEVDNTEDEKDVSNFDKLDEKMDKLMNQHQSDDNQELQDVKVVKAEGADQVKVKLSIGAGKLRLTSGSSELMLAGFIYTDPRWKPQIDYKKDGNSGSLSIKQPSTKDININDDDKYVWNLKFSNKIPLDFKIECGAGLSEIKLGDLNVNSFSMAMGVGKTELDLRGEWKKSTKIELDGGIGHTKIYLPKNVGVVLNVDKGIGSLEFSDLTQKDKTHYTNKLAETSDIILNINIKTGIGRIEIE
jgi:predicted membrane protein